VTKPRQPFAVYWTREEHQAALESYIGERVAKLQRAIRRAEERATAAEEELVELRRELHSGGTGL
jgi:DNA mismatch repair ATPase MutS